MCEGETKRGKMQKSGCFLFPGGHRLKVLVYCYPCALCDTLNKYIN